jgi:hypothetical protein
MKKHFLSGLFFLILTGSLISSAFCQDNPKNWRIYGYLKYMPSASFSTDPAFLLTNNLIHNRLNFRWYPGDPWTVGLEVRTRIMYGEEVKLNPNYGQLVDVNNGLLDLSFLIFDRPAAVMHTVLDRGFVNYSKGKWDITAGRQRINWGVNLSWNPNDLFNAFNFLDFDYEERPGSDGIRVKYFPGMLSSLEIAVSPDTSLNGTIAAFKYGFNKWKYDIQILGGLYKEDLALGIGWAGNIKDSGIKGEATYFHPRENFADTSGAFSLSVSADYLFSNGFYLNASYLLNTLGESSGNLDLSNPTLFGQVSPKNLMPTRHSFLLQGSKDITPLMRGDLAVIWSPNGNLMFFVPTLTYSVAENWDLNLIGQSFFGEKMPGYGHLGTSIFFRLKWSF